jgi:hypothetical protein
MVMGADTLLLGQPLFSMYKNLHLTQINDIISPKGEKDGIY